MRDRLPTLRAHNEQAMAQAAVAFAKANRRRRFMACTTSIGPGATNMVTAAAVAHVNRLPVLLLPGDVFASRRPDPVLQQVENFGDPTITANDCFKPVSRYWDRITRPEQILRSLPAALSVLLDPADCGPVTLALLGRRRATDRVQVRPTRPTPTLRVSPPPAPSLTGTPADAGPYANDDTETTLVGCHHGEPELVTFRIQSAIRCIASSLLPWNGRIPLHRRKRPPSCARLISASHFFRPGRSRTVAE